MRKRILFIIFIVFIMNLIGGCSVNDGQGVHDAEELNYEDIVDEIIRFHVIANSDSEEDQNLKLRVRDRVIEYVSNELRNIGNIEEAREIILNNQENIEKIAREVIGENGYSYTIDSELSKENFPDKYYGDMLFPQGEYEAFRILIGNAVGQNWWCVMFPPLCFVDETMEVVNSNEIEERIDKSKDSNLHENKSLETKNLKFKFKIFDIFSK